LVGQAFSPARILQVPRFRLRGPNVQTQEAGGSACPTKGRIPTLNFR
jgi:hypothetical protein